MWLCSDRALGDDDLKKPVKKTLSQKLKLQTFKYYLHQKLEEKRLLLPFWNLAYIIFLLVTEHFTANKVFSSSTR